MADIDSGGNKNFTFGTMKTNCWLILGMMVATAVVAQNNTNALPPVPAPAVSPAAEAAPAPAKHKKHAEPKRAALVSRRSRWLPVQRKVAVANLNVPRPGRTQGRSYQTS